MEVSKILNRILNTSEVIPFNDNSKIVIMSDCHRGDGTWADTFAKNQDTYYAALNHYYRNGFMYMELGDGDELWDNRRYNTIVNTHKDVFCLLKRYYNDDRMFMIYGNHDMVKKYDKYVKKNLYYYFDESLRKRVPLFKEIKVHEGLVLQDEITKAKTLLIHGHQADFLNNQLWIFTRFLVRHIWRPMELFGVNDPTRSAKNYNRKELIDRKYINWVNKSNVSLIAGHTHRPMYLYKDQPKYYNSGSCVHPWGITAIEIENRKFTLVKWSIKAKRNGRLYVGRDVLANTV